MMVDSNNYTPKPTIQAPSTEINSQLLQICLQQQEKLTKMAMLIDDGK